MKKFEDSLDKLREYIEKENFKGYDPYDGLNSVIPFEKFGKWPAILQMQAMKRIPFNIRPILGIRKGYNPKAIGLLLNAYSLLYEMIKDQALLDKMNFLFNWLNNNYSEGYSGKAWGYNFDWAGTSKMIKAYTPTVVVTGFVSKGLYQYFHATGDEKARDLLISASKFVLNDLQQVKTDNGVCISYTPLMMDYCYNASLLGAEILAIVFKLTNESKLADIAKKSIDFVLNYQKSDGRWNYSINLEMGIEREQIDFHQGYIIESIHNICNLLDIKDSKYHESIKSGIDFYRENQFFEEGRSKWRIPEIWPIEIHNQSQGIITFARLASLNEGYIDFAKTIAMWTINNMQHNKGYFYYRKYKYYSINIPFMRWSQAWMLLALSTLITQSKTK